MTVQASLLFERRRVTRSDEINFLVRLTVVVVFLAVGVAIQFFVGLLGIVAGVIILAATYTHMVELQHQCLHHSAFRSARWHRIVGVPLGLPLLVSYSHYRVRHLQHHQSLGTSTDSEFFGFDTRKPITWSTLLAGAFDYARLITVLREVVVSILNQWEYTQGQIAPKRRREVIAEYRLMGALLLGLGLVSVVGGWQSVLQFWVLPLVVAAPLHFLVELPEHVLCESDTRDVLRNTRSITGSKVTTWFTNGNNLHVEHHAAMSVPINQLRARHPEVLRTALHTERSYLDFYRHIAVVATANTFKRKSRPEPGPPDTDSTGQSTQISSVEDIKWLRS